RPQRRRPRRERPRRGVLLQVGQGDAEVREIHHRRWTGNRPGNTDRRSRRQRLEGHRGSRKERLLRALERRDVGRFEQGGPMKIPVLVLAAALLSSATEADEIFLKSGGQLSGRIVTRTRTRSRSTS